MAHMQRHQHITGISAYYECMRVASTVKSQKLENCDITDITVNAARDNQNAANAVAYILLSHR
jgi:hypothetical protein